LVPFRYFRLRKRGLTARADVHQTVVLVHETFVIYLLEHPPHALHERFIHGAIGILHIHEPADARNYFFPLMRVRENLFATSLIELRDAVLLYVLLVLESELFLDNVFYRKAVAVPAPDARYAIPAHGGVARDSVLY